jgi:anti-anti-sigma factor
MKFSVDRADGRVPVTILRLEGDLDASNFETLIDEGRRLHAEGTTDLLLDLRKVPFMGSSGLVALHSIVLLLNGGQADDVEAGWESLHAVGRSVESGMQPHVKVLLGPEPGTPLHRVMERTGMNRFIEVLADEQQAIGSF